MSRRNPITLRDSQLTTALDTARVLGSAHRIRFLGRRPPDKIRVGDWLVAIGNPFGLGGPFQRASCQHVIAALIRSL
jgi:S1-C subfamily serine protease